MLKAIFRLTKRQDFENVYKNGSFFSFRGITMNVLCTDNPFSRIGIVVGKGFSKSAVERNRAKRMLREATKRNIPNILSGYDIIVGYKPRTAYGSLREILPVLEELFKRHRLLK